MDNNYVVYNSLNSDDLTKYEIKGLADRFKSLDIAFEQEGNKYYFRADVMMDDVRQVMQFENIDTNLLYVEELDAYQASRYNNFGICGINSEGLCEWGLSLWNIDSLDGEKIIINGIEITHSDFVQSLRDEFGVVPATAAYLESDDEVQVIDGWIDADSTDFKFYVRYYEAEDYLDWNSMYGFSIDIDYDDFYQITRK